MDHGGCGYDDPAVNAYGRALLTNNPHTVFATPEVASLDWTRSMVLMQCLTLHHVADAIDPWRLMRRYVEALPSGSYVAVSHLSNPGDGEGAQIAEAMEHAMRDSSMESGWFRSPAQIQTMLEGLQLLEPGLVPLEQWWPSGPREPSPTDPVAVGAVAYKPWHGTRCVRIVRVVSRGASVGPGQVLVGTRACGCAASRHGHWVWTCLRCTESGQPPAPDAIVATGHEEDGSPIESRSDRRGASISATCPTVVTGEVTR